MAISLQADSTLPQGYILVDGQRVASVSTTGGLSANTIATNTITTNTFNVAQEARFTNINETLIYPTIQSNVLNLVLSSSTFFVVNLVSNITTINFLNPPPSQRVYSFVLQLCASGTAYPVAWPTTVKWPFGTPPALTTTANKVDTFTFTTYDQGANYFGFISGLNS